MHRVLHAFLLWALVFALPVQGMAASAMLFCGPGHGHVVDGQHTGGLPAQAHPVAAHDLTAAAHGPHAHGATHGHGNVHAHADAHADVHAHAGPVSPAADPFTADAEAPTSADPLSPQGPASCSACAACCFALALPASLVLPASLGPVHLAPTSPVQPVASRPSDGIDRPPRTALA